MMPLGPAPRNAPTPTVRYRGSRQLLNFHRRSHKTQESGAGQTHQTGDSASRLMGGRFAWLMGGRFAWIASSRLVRPNALKQPNIRI